MIRFIGPENFEKEVITEKKSFLLLVMPPGSEFPKQVEIIEETERKHGPELKAGLVHEDFIEKFKEKYRISGTPTFLFFLRGKEKDRLLGLANRETLTSFILKCCTLST